MFAALRALAWGYLAGLAIFIALLAIGERWWVSVVALYLPRFALLAPLLALAPLATKRTHRRLFAATAAGAVVLVVAIAGPHVSLPARRGSGPSMRVFSYNVWYGRRGMDAIEREVDRASADVVVFQALSRPVAEHFGARFGDTMHTHATGEFFLASRFPIVETGPATSPAFLRYTLATPLGPIDLFAVHPLSPRPGLNELRHQSKRRLLTEGPSAEAARELDGNTALREQEIAELDRATAAAENPVVIAGDTNLPELSAIYRRHLSRFRDGFADVGNGFGYTFPANVAAPWMRIDRILSGGELRFTSFHVGGRGGSDHCPVWADLERR